MKIVDDYKERHIMKIGQKIKRLRKLRSFTQKELGVKCGFKKQSADVRIAQYESGARTTKTELIEDISKILDVNPRYLCEHSGDSIEDIIFTLFDIDDTHGLSISLINGIACLMFNTEISKRLLEWYSMKNKLSYKEITEEEYHNWKYNISFIAL